MQLASLSTRLANRLLLRATSRSGCIGIHHPTSPVRSFDFPGPALAARLHIKYVVESLTGEGMFRLRSSKYILVVWQFRKSHFILVFSFLCS